MAKRILVPLDDGSNCATILPLVADLARGGATVRLVHVAPTPDNLVDSDGRIIAYAGQEMQRLETEWRDSLVADESVLDGVSLEHVVRFGDPVGEILAEADEFSADLIVVTTSCRSAVTRRLLGSIAEHVVRRATPAVLLLRPAL